MINDKLKPVPGDAGVFLSLTGRLVYPEDDRVLRFLREGWFEYRELATVSRLVRPGDCFIDVGAHCGLYSKLVARRMSGVGTVIVVEPNPALHPFIVKNVEIARTVTDGVVHAGEICLVKAAVATGRGEAILHTKNSGWSAYSSLQPAVDKGGSHDIAVVSRTLESLITEQTTDHQVIIKLDIEGLEYDIFHHAAPFLKERGDNHLMIEFDENNLAPANRTTAQLRDLVTHSGYLLAELNPITFRLEPFEREGPLWGANLIATRNLDLLNFRLATAEEDVATETVDFLKRGQAAERLYLDSEDLNKVLHASAWMTEKVEEATSVLEGRPEVPSTPEHVLKPMEIIGSLEERISALIGAARWMTEQVQQGQQANVERDDRLAHTATTLADFARMLTSAAEELSVPLELTLETTLADLETRTLNERLELLVALAVDRGAMLAGVARWYGVELAAQKTKLNTYLQGAARMSDALSALQAGRLELAKLIAGTALRRDMEVAKNDFHTEATLLQQRMKECLARAAWSLSFGARQFEAVGGEASAPTDEDVLKSELTRMQAQNRSLTAEFHRLAILLKRTRNSRWLRLGERLGIDVVRQLDMAGALIADMGGLPKSPQDNGLGRSQRTEE